MPRLVLRTDNVQGRRCDKPELCHADNVCVSHRLCPHCSQNFANARYCIRVNCLNRFGEGWYRYHIKCYGRSKYGMRLRYTRDLIPCTTKGNSHSDWNIDSFRLRSFGRTNDFPSVDEETKQELYRYLFPWVALPEQRPLLTLHKPIDEMTIHELRQESKKRDLSRHGEKSELVQQLREYLGRREVRTARAKYMVRGYCRSIPGAKNKVNIPVYLRQIVVDYLCGAGTGTKAKAMRPKMPKKKKHKMHHKSNLNSKSYSYDSDSSSYSSSYSD